MSPIQVVTFDFWNTLMWEGPDALVSARVRALTGVLEESGFHVSEADLLGAHAIAFEHYQRAWRANTQFCVPDAARVMIDHLGLPNDARLHRDLCEAFDHAGDAAELHLCEGVESCLRALDAEGIRLAIVCDIGLTPSPVLRRRLDTLGLLSAFGSWAFSDEVGFYKPAREIFDRALEGLGGATPDRAAHVGDRRRTDVAGAKALGMLAVRYTGVYDDPDFGPDGDLVIAHLDALAGALPLT